MKKLNLVNYFCKSLAKDSLPGRLGKPPPRKKFVPEEFGLEKDFLLTNFSELKGWGSKVPQTKLMSYINNIGGGEIGKTTPDNSVFQVRNSNLS